MPCGPIQILTCPFLSGYSSFAVTSFAEGSEVMLRKNGQVGIGSNIALKIVQPS